MDALLEMVPDVSVFLRHFCDEGDAGDQDSVVLLTQHGPSGRQKGLHQFWLFVN